MYYNRHRYYDSHIGSFISQDPIGLEGGFNVYEFAPNVFGWVDPWGLSCSTDAKELNRALGGPIDGFDAHHIVMSNSKDIRMRFLRRRMKRMNIGINEAINGIHLPRNQAFKNATGSTATDCIEIHINNMFGKRLKEQKLKKTLGMDFYNYKMTWLQE